MIQKKAVKMMKKNIKFEVVSHDKIAQMRQENDSKLFKLNAVQLPESELKDAEKALELIPVTNKMYLRLQHKLEVAKEKEERKKREQELNIRLARIRDHQHEQDDELYF